MILENLGRSIIFAICMTIGAAHATSFYPQSFPTTIQEAPIIVRGRVGMSYANWGTGENENKKIYTYTEIQTSEVLKGEAQSPTIMIREPGGEKDGVGLHVPGTSQYERGEDVVVMLRESNSDGSFDVQGMMMGKLNIQEDSSGEEVLTGPALTTNEMFQHQGMPQSKEPQKKWTLNALRQLIRTQSEAHKLRKEPQPKSSIPSALPSKNPGDAPSPAPQLQHEGSIESGGSESPEKTFQIYVEFGLVVFLGVVLLLKLIRKRK